MNPQEQLNSPSPHQPSQPTPPPPTPSFPANKRPAKKRRGEGLKGILSTLLILLIAPLVALLLTAFVFQSYEVDGPSMQTTLQNHDRLIVYKVPRTWARITGNDYTPKRGDIIIFIKHNLREFNDPVDDKQLIKRVIGLPGDHVVVKDGKVTIYNAAHPEGYDPDAGTQYIADSKGTPGEANYTIKPGQVFVSGDNRNNSLDSRYFGPIDQKDIVGKLLVRVFPLNQFKLF